MIQLVYWTLLTNCRKNSDNPDLILDHTPESVLDWMYGYYCFTFLNQESGLIKISLNMARNNLSAFAFQNDHFSIDPWLFTGSQPFSLQKVQVLLSQNDIAYQLTLRDYHQTPAIRLESNVLLCFERLKEDENSWYLDGFVLEVY